MAKLDNRAEPLSVSCHRIVRPSAQPQHEQPATFSLGALFAATTAVAIYLGLVQRSIDAALTLSPLLCFALTFVYFTRHYRLCFGRAMVRAVAFGTISAGVLPTLFTLAGHPVDAGTVLFGCWAGFIICGSAAFVLAVGTVIIEACIGR